MSTFNHAFDIAFEVISNNEGENIQPEELRAGILRRLASVDDRELLEACGAPFDTMENTTEKREFNEPDDTKDAVYIVKGTVTDDEAHENARVGDVEWQFSDGPPGNRGQSADYADLAKGLREHSGRRLIWIG